MKKLTLGALLLVSSISAICQTSATIKIENHTDYEICVVMYGYAPSYCGSGDCNSTHITNTICVPSGWGLPSVVTSWGPYTPCNVSSVVGWSTELCSTSWCSSLPSDFQWTLAKVYANGAVPCWGSIFPMNVSDGQTIGCEGATYVSGPYSGSCGGLNSLKTTWTTSGAVSRM